MRDELASHTEVDDNRTDR